MQHGLCALTPQRSAFCTCRQARHKPQRRQGKRIGHFARRQQQPGQCAQIICWLQADVFAPACEPYSMVNESAME